MRPFKSFSIFSSLYTLLFLATTNSINSSYPWFLFCVPPVFIWPLAVVKPKIFAKQSFAWSISLAVIAYYLLLNIVMGHQYPWVIHIAFAIIWYPFSLHFARKHSALGLSLYGFVWTVVYFVTLNWLSSPDTIWAIYPIFAVAWWPLSIFFFVHRAQPRS